MHTRKQLTKLCTALIRLRRKLIEGIDPYLLKIMRLCFQLYFADKIGHHLHIRSYLVHTKVGIEWKYMMREFILTFTNRLEDNDTTPYVIYYMLEYCKEIQQQLLIVHYGELFISTSSNLFCFCKNGEVTGPKCNGTRLSFGHLLTDCI